MNDKELKKIIEAVVKQVVSDGSKEQESAMKKIPPTPIEKIPDIIKKLSKNEIINYFGLDIGNNKENPYKCLQKKFIEAYNITSDSKYKPRLTLEHKHLIIRKIMQGKSKKEQERIKNMCISYLKQRINNPPSMLYGKPATEKQKQHLIENYKKEVERWNSVQI